MAYKLPLLQQMADENIYYKNNKKPISGLQLPLLQQMTDENIYYKN